MSSARSEGLLRLLYLAAELEVNHDNGNLRAAQHENDKDEEEEAKQVVVLIVPDGLQKQKDGDKESGSLSKKREKDAM